jgi:hypothetical protein
MEKQNRIKVTPTIDADRAKSRDKNTGDETKPGQLLASRPLATTMYPTSVSQEMWQSSE